jgi:hypothetical protein
VLGLFKTGGVWPRDQFMDCERGCACMYMQLYNHHTCENVCMYIHIVHAHAHANTKMHALSLSLSLSLSPSLAHTYELALHNMYVCMYVCRHIVYECIHTHTPTHTNTDKDARTHAHASMQTNKSAYLSMAYIYACSA